MSLFDNRSGELSLDTALRCSEYIVNERQYGPWYQMTTAWDYVGRMLNGNKLFGQFRVRVGDIFNFEDSPREFKLMCAFICT